MTVLDVRDAGRRVRALLTDPSGAGHTPGRWALDTTRWDWNPGVGMIGLAEYARVEPDALLDVKAWVGCHLHGRRDARSVNGVAPCAVLPPLYAVTGDGAHLDAACETAGWLVRDAPRTRDGALEHTVEEHASFPGQVWADTVFMAALFLARHANVTRDATLAREAITQLLMHLRVLQDPETHLLFHAWSDATRTHLSGARWARANAWVTLGVPLALRELRWTPWPSELTQRYARLAHAVVARQRPDGLWPTVLDRPEFQAETSASAGLAAGLLEAASLRLVNFDVRPTARRALEGVLARVHPSGEVSGVSSGTPVLATVEDYDRVPTHATLYGQGLTLLLLASVHAHGEGA